MWLLDVNVPRQTIEALAGFGVTAEHTTKRGWGHLKNGELVEAAVLAGFECVLTRDRLFAESAGRALRQFPTFAVVILRIPQLRKDAFTAAFLASYARQPIVPRAGALISWPSAESRILR